MNPDPVRGLTMGSFAAHGSSYRGSYGHGNTGQHHSFNGWGMVNEWEEQAACKDSPLELWFGDEHPPGVRKSFRTKQQTAQAKAICARCPVLDNCRLWALKSGIPFGIVGMMTEVERKQLALQDQKAWQKFWRQQDIASGRIFPNSRKTHCPHGHEYSPENTYVRAGKRFCLACQNRRSIEYRQRKKAELGHWPWQQQRQENGHKAG